METILVTGGAGFIGSNLVTRLIADNNYKVVVIDNFHSYYPKHIKQSNIQSWINSKEVEFHETDLFDFKKMNEILALHSISSVVHLAALPGVRNSIKYEEEINQINVKGTQRIIDYCKDFGIQKIVFASSSSIYGNSPQTPWKESEFISNFLNPYSKSKYLSEELGQNFASSNSGTFIALRLFSIYGPNLRPDLVLNKFYDRIITSQLLSIYGSLDNSRDFTNIEDACSAFISAITTEKKGFNIFNVGNSKPIPLRRVIELFNNQIPSPTHYEIYPSNEIEASVTFADISKAKEELGWTPKIDFETGFESFLKWKKG